jgi:glucokinase
VAFAGLTGDIVASKRIPTGSLSDPRCLIRWIVEQLDMYGEGRQVASLAIGAAGPIDPTRGRLLNPPNLNGWRDVPLVGMLAEEVGCPVYLENDANLAGLAEFHAGAGQGYRQLIYITWSTGVGASLILDGQLYKGAHGLAGEIGHMVLEPEGPTCGCGQRGCLEALSGGAALQRQTGQPLAKLFEAAAAGDEGAATIVRRAATYLGQALVNLTNLLDPEVFVIGGGVTRSWVQVEPVIRTVLASSPFIRPERQPQLRLAQLGDSAGQIGAVQLARMHLNHVGD